MTHSDNMSVKHLVLPVRAINALLQAGVDTVGHLRRVPDSHLLREPNIGRITMKNIRNEVPLRLRPGECLLTTRSEPASEYVYRREHYYTSMEYCDWIAVLAGEA